MKIAFRQIVVLLGDITSSPQRNTSLSLSVSDFMWLDFLPQKEVSKHEEREHPLLNADDMEGAFCITLRGGCSFQTKYENCKAAGAIGALVINREDVFIDMTSKFSVDMKRNCT